MGRDRSVRALRERLEDAGMSAGGAEQTIETLVRAGLVDDRRLALRRAAFLAGRGLGDEAIAAKLDAEGIGIEERRAALATLEPEERRAVEVARREAGRPVVRIAALLARRGFGEDAVEAAVASLDASRRPEVP